MTLAEYREAVRSQIDDSEYDDTVVDRAINWYVKDICSRIHLRFMEATEEVTVSEGDTEVEFPDEMQTLLNLSVTDPTPARQIFKNYVEYNQFIIDNPGFESVTSRGAANADWTDFGGKMRFSAPINATSTLLCEFLNRPEKMENDDDECVIPDQYDEMVTLGAQKRVMKRNEDYAEAKQESSDLSRLETTFIKNEGRGHLKVGATVMNSRRGRRGSWRADRDFNG